MSFPRAPLPPGDLPASLDPFFAPDAPPARLLMLAKGMAPGLGPEDLLIGLYQTTFQESEKLAAAASKTAAELPDNILEGALKSPLPAMVLDFCAQVLRDRRAHVQQILLNPRTPDETFFTLARSLRDDGLLEIIAGNEQRLLRLPAIIEALYLNAKTRMSTANRCMEFAVRNQLDLELPAYKEIARALGAESTYADPGDREWAEAAADAAFEEAIADGGEETVGSDAIEVKEEDDGDLAKKASLLGLTIAQKIRLALVGSGYHRALLLRDPNRTVAMAAIKSPKIREAEVVSLTMSRSVNDDVIRYIANNRDWLKLYQVKAGLVNNPKCPLPTSMRLLPHLRVTDLRTVSRSRNVPHALRQAAQQMINRKS